MPFINTLRPAIRNSHPIPNLWQNAGWTDSLLLASNAPAAYAVPVDVNGNKGQILRVTGNGGGIYCNFYGTAAIPSTNITNGSSSNLIRTDLGPVLIFVPPNCTSVSFIASFSVLLTIEAYQ